MKAEKKAVSFMLPTHLATELNLLVYRLKAEGTKISASALIEMAVKEILEIYKKDDNLKVI